MLFFLNIESDQSVRLNCIEQNTKNIRLMESIQAERLTIYFFQKS